MFFQMIKLLLLSFCQLILGTPTKRSTTINVSGNGYSSSPNLYGLMIEDISHSISRGLYAERLENRAFQMVPTGTSTASLNAWTSFGGCSISVVNNSTVSSLSSALPNSLAVNITAATGGFGVANSGYGGIGVSSSTPFFASFFAKASGSISSPVNAALVSTSTGALFASAVIVPANGMNTEWKLFTVTLNPSYSASDTENTLVINFNDATGSQGKTVWLTLFSLFTPTYNNRPNGMRPDIATALKKLNPKFLRFPGGNNIEGHTIDTRWKWYDTVGPLVDRPGRSGDWGYINNDGFGLLEFLLACEDLAIEPYMAVYAGYSLNGQSVPENDFDWVVQDAVNQIQYAIGDAAFNQFAAMRAADGHPSPFNLKVIEIGNEESTYDSYRWNRIASGIQVAFPSAGLQLMSTNGQASVSPSTTTNLHPSPSWIDAHVYQIPSWFIDNEGHFDVQNYARTGQKVFLGEYAVTSASSSCLFGSTTCGRYQYPVLAGSIGEAVWLTGLERNSDLIGSASFAPLLGSTYSTQWTPNLITFTPSQVILSTSYYVQMMFGAHKGDTILPASPPRSSPVFYVVSKKSDGGVVFVKAVNTQSTPYTLELNFDSSIGIGTKGVATTLTGNLGAFNSPSSPNSITPSSSTFTAGQKFSYAFPGNAVVVLAISR